MSGGQVAWIVRLGFRMKATMKILRGGLVNKLVVLSVSYVPHIGIWLLRMKKVYNFLPLTLNLPICSMCGTTVKPPYFSPAYPWPARVFFIYLLLRCPLCLCKTDLPVSSIIRHLYVVSQLSSRKLSFEWAIFWSRLQPFSSRKFIHLVFRKFRTIYLIN